MKNWLKVIIKVLLSFAALYFVFTKIDAKQLWVVFTEVKWLWLLPAALLFILSKVIAAFRLNDLLKCIGINISHRFNLKLYLLGMYYNLFLPGGIGGDGYKIFLLGKEFDVSRKKIFYAVLLDRVSGLGVLGILVVAIVGFGWVLSQWSLYAWFLIPVGLLAFYLLIKWLFPYFIPSFLKMNLFSLGVQISQVISVLFILAALGIREQHVEYIFLFLLSSIVAAIPFTIGGAGARELTFLFGAENLGLNTDVSVALSLIFYLITAIVSFSGIYFSFYTRKLEE